MGVAIILPTTIGTSSNKRVNYGNCRYFLIAGVPDKLFRTKPLPSSYTEVVYHRDPGSGATTTREGVIQTIPTSYNPNPANTGEGIYDIMEGLMHLSLVIIVVVLCIVVIGQLQKVDRKEKISLSSFYLSIGNILPCINLATAVVTVISFLYLYNFNNIYFDNAYSRACLIDIDDKYNYELEPFTYTPIFLSKGEHKIVIREKDTKKIIDSEIIILESTHLSDRLVYNVGSMNSYAIEKWRYVEQ